MTDRNKVIEGLGLVGGIAALAAILLLGSSPASAHPLDARIVVKNGEVIAEGVAVTDGYVIIRDSRNPQNPILNKYVPSGPFHESVDVPDADSQFTLSFRPSGPVGPGVQPSGESSPLAVTKL